MKRRAVEAVLLAACLAGCQVLFGYDGFEGSSSVDAGPPPHPCEVLPPVKVVESGQPPAVSRVNLPGGSCAWIDQSEVTVDQYQTWLTAVGAKPLDWASLGSAGECNWKEGLPSNPAGSSADACRMTIDTLTEHQENDPFQATKPIRCVDWCDAHAYCKWAGKRLCFGTNNSGLLTPVGKPFEWDIACNVDNSHPYPYGASYDPRACNVDQSPARGCITANGTVCGPTAVGFLEACRATRSSPSDLSGNVQEWIGLCDKPGGADALCNRRGGSYLDPPERATCLYIGAAARRDRDRSTGFRCCADLTAREVTILQANSAP